MAGVSLRPPEVETATTARSRKRTPLARRPAWQQRYVVRLVATDAVAVAVSGALAQALRFGFDEATLVSARQVVPYPVAGLLATPIWLIVLGLGGAYAPNILGTGSEEYRRVFNAGARFLALVAVVVFVAKLNPARSFVGGLIVLATVFTLVGRRVARRRLHRRRYLGADVHRVLVVGSIEAASELTRHLLRTPAAGFAVVGACTPSDGSELVVGSERITVYGTPGTVLEALVLTQCDVVAIAGDSALPPGALRTLAWQLEGSGVDLVVAPALTDVAGPRIAIRPVSGLPLLYVEEPQLSGGARFVKGCFDRIVALLVLLTLAPVLVTIAVVVRLTSPGPALYCQERVGRHGRRFTIRKFRTMVNDADQQLINLVECNEHEGVLFKIRDDPRCTPFGRWLRRYSLDELPQLWHVVTGEMSLVGPRPPLPSEVERYGDDVRRRLLVKPGLTGLWQVSGRADLAWEESVRLDLYYVDNWSTTMDMVILWKTVRAVIQGRGAY